MYDSVNFRLLQDEAGGVDFLSETACLLENIGEHNYSGEVVITGSFGGLSVSLSRRAMKVKDGSLCKWFLGDNFQTMGRGDTQRAIEKLSDALHVPMNKAAVTRLDIAQNFIVKFPLDVYFNHLGELRYANRLQEPDGLYYKQTGGRLCFYDKIRERQKDKGATIPELYQGRNVLRYEQRYLARIAKRLNRDEVTGATLYDEAFYIDILKRWRDNYRAIQKINDVSLNCKIMKTIKEFDVMGRLSLIERWGGQRQMIEQINEAYKRGELTRKQAYDLRRVINDACSKIKVDWVTPSEAIQELNKKVSEAVKFYR